MFGPPLQYHHIQQDFLAYTGRYCSVLSGRRSGKTEICIRKILEQVSIEREYQSVYWYMIPLEMQVIKCIFSNIKQRLSDDWSILPHSICMLSPCKNKLYLVGADNIKTYEKMQLDGVIIDESSDFPPGLADKHILPMLNYRGGFLYRTGVPIKGRIGYEEYRDWYGSHKRFEWSSCEFLTEEQLNQMKEWLGGEQEIQEQIYGRFVDISK